MFGGAFFGPVLFAFHYAFPSGNAEQRTLVGLMEDVHDEDVPPVQQPRACEKWSSLFCFAHVCAFPVCCLWMGGGVWGARLTRLITKHKKIEGLRTEETNSACRCRWQLVNHSTCAHHCNVRQRAIFSACSAMLPGPQGTPVRPLST